MHSKRPRYQGHWLCLLLVATLACTLVSIQPAAAKKRGRPTAAPATQLRGINLTPNVAFAPSPDGLPDDQNAQEIGSACRLGSNLVRVFVSWFNLEPAPGVVDPVYAHKLDSLMAQAQRCNIQVMLMLEGTPKWASTAAPTDRLSPLYPSRNGAGDYRWMVGWILHQWPQLNALEVWNEPNQSNYWRGTPGQYAALVNAAVAAKRDVGASTRILAGTLSMGATSYLRELYAAGMQGQDGISVHPYAVSCSPVCGSFSGPASRQSPFRTAIDDVHRVMVENADPAGLWLTEFGYATCPSQPACVSPETQGAWMAESIRVAACYPYVKGLTAFTLRDVQPRPGWDVTSWTLHFGLMNTDFSPKPAFGTVAAAYQQLSRAEASRAAHTKGSRARKAAKGSSRAKRARVPAGLPGSPKCKRLLGGASHVKKRTKRKR